MDIDTSGVTQYLEECRDALGDKWVKAADATTLDGIRNVGGAVKEYAINCYMRNIKVSTCVRDIKKRFPETNK